jgi:hypothetical protein
MSTTHVKGRYSIVPGTKVFECWRCAALVLNKDAHDLWHNKIDKGQEQT